MIRAIKKGLLMSVFGMALAALSFNAEASRLADGLGITDNCSKYGSDSITTVKHYSIYYEYFKQKNYDAAKSSWQYVYTNAPGFHEVVVANGIEMYKHWAKEATDPAVKKGLIDSLMMIYDKRVECYANTPEKECDIKIRKAYDALEVIDQKDYEWRAAILKKTMDECGTSVTGYILSSYFATQYMAYQAKKITIEQMLDIADDLGAIRNSIKDPNKAADLDAAIDYIDQTLPIGDISCEQLIGFTKPKWEENKDNLEWLQRTYSKLYKVDCKEDPFFAQVRDRLDELDPSPDAKRRQAIRLLREKKYTEAIAKYREAIALEEEAGRKAADHLAIAEVYEVQGQFSNARTEAYKALDLKPGWGKVYILVGDLYARSGATCGGSGSINGVGVAWVAFDEYAKAKSDPDFASAAQTKMNKMAGYFPLASSLFQMNVEVGSTVTIGCWIGRSTKARAK